MCRVRAKEHKIQRPGTRAASKEFGPRRLIRVALFRTLIGDVFQVYGHDAAPVAAYQVARLFSYLRRPFELGRPLAECRRKSGRAPEELIATPGTPDYVRPPR